MTSVTAPRDQWLHPQDGKPYTDVLEQIARPDLSQRTMISKSAVVGWDLCATKAGFEITDRRPLILNEKISFGSALDAACEVLIKGHQKGWDAATAHSQAMDAVMVVGDRDEIELPLEELSKALLGFHDEVIPRFDWTNAKTQPEVSADIAGLGDVQGHPDIILGDYSVWDVKSSSRKKELPSVELGLYAILVEEAQGIEVPQVGYLTWVRQGRGHWEIQPWLITSEARRWAWARVNQYAKARETGAFFGAPKFAGLCDSCQYSPANSGPCEIAWNGEGKAA